MQVFISWSGDRSKALANALSELLPDAVQELETWMSDVTLAQVPVGITFNPKSP